MKIYKIASVLTAVLFVVIIFGVAIVSAYEVKTDYQTYSYYENRNLALLPKIEKETVLNGKYFSSFDTWYRDHIAFRSTVLTYDTLLNMNVIRRPVVNEVVITDDVLLPYNKPESVDYDKITELANGIATKLRSHTDLCESYGAKFYYVAVPCQYVYYEDSYPWYLNSRAEYTDATSTALFSALDAKGVSYIDMLAVFDSLGHKAEYSSTVDNHYSIFGALETYNAILTKVNEDTELNIDIMTSDDYTVTTLPNTYIGSRTRKLLGLWRSDEKLSIITPNDYVPFTRYNYGNTTPSYSFVYAMPQCDTEDVLYRLYMGDDCSITRIETNRPELPTILVYGDSFTNALESLIWYNFDTMYSLDFRYYDEMTLEAFIAEYKPDIVVCVRDYEQLVNPYDNGQ